MMLPCGCFTIKPEDLNPVCRDNPFGTTHCFHHDHNQKPRPAVDYHDYQITLVKCCFCGIELEERHGLKLKHDHESRKEVYGRCKKCDESRRDQLRAIGNGVVPLQAAYALSVLARQMGIVL